MQQLAPPKTPSDVALPIKSDDPLIHLFACLIIDIALLHVITLIN